MGATPQERLKRTIENFSDLKSAAYMQGLTCMTNMITRCLPKNMMRKAASETFSKHSLLVTNVPGPSVPVTFPKEGGEIITEVHMVCANVIPQVSFVSWNGYVHGNICADPQFIPDMAKFGELYRAEIIAFQEECSPA